MANRLVYNKEYYTKNKHKWQEYYDRNPGKYNAANKKNYQRIKDKVFDLFGKHCVRCGFLDVRALQLDHKNGGGVRHRKETGGTYTVYKAALENPEDFQILCANCNWIKRHEENETGFKVREK